MDGAQRGRGEDVAHLAVARHLEPVAHVRDRLVARERADVPAQRDALVQLRQLGVREQRAQLRLSDQDDAQQLLGGGLEVREEPQLLQHLDRQRLRLVHHDDGAAARRRRCSRRWRFSWSMSVFLLVDVRRQAELDVDRLQQLERRQGRVDDVGDARLGRQLAEEVPQQGRLARCRRRR